MNHATIQMKAISGAYLTRTILKTVNFSNSFHALAKRAVRQAENVDIPSSYRSAFPL
jgi:hypothetical protein